jgi:hypothetical protein
MWPRTLSALARSVAAQDLFLVEAVLPIRAELVILTALLGIVQHLIGLVDVLEHRLGLLVVRIYVRMILARELAVRRLDIGLRCGPLDAQSLVIVLEFHGNRVCLMKMCMEPLRCNHPRLNSPPRS